MAVTSGSANAAPPLLVGPRSRAIGAAAILGASVMVYFVAGTAPAQHTASIELPSATPLAALSCSMLEPSSALNQSLAGLYNGFSLQGYRPGPNGTPALGISSYPNLAVGERALIAAWGSICQSPQFAGAYQQANGSSGFFSGGELAQDGHYVFFYGFTWQDRCPPGTPGSMGACEATATWTVDLVTDMLLAPTFTNLPAMPLGGAPPAP